MKKYSVMEEGDIYPLVKYFKQIVKNWTRFYDVRLLHWETNTNAILKYGESKKYEGQEKLVLKSS